MLLMSEAGCSASKPFGAFALASLIQSGRRGSNSIRRLPPGRRIWRAADPSDCDHPKGADLEPALVIAQRGEAMTVASTFSQVRPSDSVIGSTQALDMDAPMWARYCR